MRVDRKRPPGQPTAPRARGPLPGRETNSGFGSTPPANNKTSHYHPDEARCTCETLVSVFCLFFFLLFTDISILTNNVCEWIGNDYQASQRLRGRGGRSPAEKPIRLNPTRQSQKSRPTKVHLGGAEFLRGW